MADTIENGAEVENAKRTDRRVRIDFIGPDGTVHKHPVAGCTKIKAVFIEAGGEDEVLDLSECEPDMIYRLAAFGASTLGRNEVNTAKAEDGAEAAADNLRSRWNGFRNNSYRSLSSGSATPLILLALARALKAHGLDETAIATKVSAYQKKYDGNEGDDDKALRKARSEVGKALRAVPEIREAEKAIRLEREEARAANAKQASLSDI